MTRADAYNQRQIDRGELGIDDVTALVRRFQEARNLAVDGMAGPQTLSALRRKESPLECWPLPQLDDGRDPVVTSRSRWHNPSRPTHHGVDIMYPWREGDPLLGPGRVARANGQPRWWVPEGAVVVAAGAGVVRMAGRIRTGLRCWIEHEGGIRSGYFHLETLEVADGDRVEAGDVLGTVGADPRGGVAHLHWEVSPVGRYEPMAPEPYLDGLPMAG